ncbi:hypothetical protein ABZY81_23860 [Streptomyces sp. NPDC006514]|uniref:hypothetical protein n=1 Tax=Streptomyces sp. NPDC006514 TaxID=3154308 RepID=UPI0033ACF1D7
MPETTDYHYTIAAKSPVGLVATRSGVLTLEPIATRAGVINYLLRSLKQQHGGPDFSLVQFDITPNLR